jgi:parallel beta-helix repeat protein
MLMLLWFALACHAATTVYLPSPGSQIGSIALSSCSDTTPIVCTATSHGLANGAAVWIQGVTGITNADGFFNIGNVTTNTFTLENYLYFPSFVPSGNGAYGGKGVLTPLTAYTLNSNPRVYLDGPNGTLTNSLQNAAANGKANSSNYVFGQLGTAFNDFDSIYTQTGVDAQNSSTGTGMQRYAISGLYWFAAQKSGSPASQALTVAKYGIDNVEQIVTNPVGFYCDESPGAEQCGRDHSAVMDWPSSDIVSTAESFSLMHDQLSAAEISNFADKMLNDNSIVPNANSARGNGFGGIDGDPTTSCTPWPSGAAWTQPAHYCGFFWMEKHQDYVGVMLPGEESSYSTRDYPNTGFGEAYPYAGNLEMTKTYGMIATGLALADDDVRARSLLTQVYCYWYRWYYAYALSSWTGMTQLGARYTVYRGAPFVTGIAEMLKNSIPGFDLTGGNWLQQMIPMFVYTQLPGTGAGIGVNTGAHDNWEEAQSGPFQIDPRDYWAAYTTLLMSFPSNAYAPYLRYSMLNQSPFTTYNLSRNTGDAFDVYIGYDPAAATSNPSGNIGTQYLFSDTDYGYCESVFKRTAQAVSGNDPNRDLSGCYPNHAYSGAVTKSDWTPSATHVLIQTGFNDGLDHSGCGDWGSLHIYRNGYLLAGDASQANGSAHANTGDCAGQASDVLIQLGSGDNWAQPGYGLVARWAGTDPTGDPQSRYAYLDEDLSNAYTSAMNVVRAQRSVLHLKKSGTQDYVIVYDDIALSAAHSISALWDYWLQNSNTVTAGTRTVTNTSTGNGRLLTSFLAVNGQLGMADDGATANVHKYHTCPSSDGATCLASPTSFEEAVVHLPSTSTTAAMPSISQPACTATGGDCTVVDIQDASSPKVAVFARQGALLTAASFASTHNGSAQYVIAGLSPGSYTVTLNGAAIAGSPFSVAGGDNTLYFEGSSGAYNIVQSSVASSGGSGGSSGGAPPPSNPPPSDPPPPAGSQPGASCGGTTLCVGAGQQYATIQAAANAAVAGDTVLVMDGTYTGFQSVNGGTASAPVTFKANSANVTVNSSGDSNGDCINIENTDYVIVDGFQVTGCARAGIRSALATGVIIRNNVVTNSAEWGIFTAFTPQLQILNNKTSGTTGQHGIYVSNSDVANDNPVIQGNESWGNAGNGIQLNGDCTSPDPNGYSDGVISGAVIANNLVHDNQQKGFSLIDVQSSTIENNVVYNNGISGAAGGIHLAEQDSCTADPSSNNVIVNNTIVEPRIAGIRITTGTNNVVFNNIAVSSSPIVDESGGPNQIDTVSNLQTASSAGLFVNAGSNDYHLAAGSAAIGAGVASYAGKPAPATDYDGNARPQGSRFDSGAYEYVTTDPSCTYTLSTATASYGAAGASGSVSVSSSSGCTWTASSNASWITISSGASGSGAGAVSYSVAANTSTSSRTGTLTIGGQTFTITQSGAACSYSLSAASASYGASGGSGSVTLTTTSGCNWSASSNVSWITISSGASGSGAGSAGYSVAANTSTSSRTGTLTIGGQTFTATESGAAAPPPGSGSDVIAAAYTPNSGSSPIYFYTLSGSSMQGTTSSWRISPFSLAYSPDASLLYVNPTSGGTDVYPVGSNGIATSTLFATLTSSSGIDDNGPVISSDGTIVALPIDSADSSAGVQLFQKSGSAYAKLPTITFGPYATGSASFDPNANHLAVALNASGGQAPATPQIFKRNGTQFSLLAGQPNVPFQDTYAYEHSLVAFSPDGAYLYATDEGTDDTGHNLRIYTVSGDKFTWLTGQPKAQLASPGPIAVSPDNTYVAVSNTYSKPYLAIYKRSGNTFTQLASPATLPNSQLQALTFTPDGQYLVVTETKRPYILAYQINAANDTFTALPAPALVPAQPLNALSAARLTQ